MHVIRRPLALRELGVSEALHYAAFSEGWTRNFNILIVWKKVLRYAVLMRGIFRFSTDRSVADYTLLSNV